MNFLQVEFSPTLSKLASIVNDTATHLTDCLAVFQRLPDLLTKKRSTRPVCEKSSFPYQFCSILGLLRVEMVCCLWEDSQFVQIIPV